MDLFLELNL